MPRKLNYDIAYDDDMWDEEDDYGDEEHYVEEDASPIYAENKVVPLAEMLQESSKRELWRCHICTYDNEEGMNSCDICGCLRYPLVKPANKYEEKPVGNTCKDNGASKLAKSLFASPLKQTAKQALMFKEQADGFVKSDGINSQKMDSINGNVQNFHEASSSYKNRYINIVPFKFDTPSPDDLVSQGLLSKKNFKGNSVKSLANDKNARESSAADDKKPSESLTASYKKTSESLASAKKGKLIEKGKSNSTANENIRTNLTSHLDNINLNEKPVSSKNEKVNANKSTSLDKFIPDKWVVPAQGEGDSLMTLNLGIVGHVDSGKSTLSGRLLHLTGRISDKQMHKFRKEANMQGKGSFAYAFAMDESAEERERGITMAVAVAYFDTKRYHIVLLDAPGHKDFVPNMISGATQADAAILVVDASIGAFEAGMENVSGQGQTKEHAQLIRSFGVDQIIIAVNKMDIIDYSSNRFDLIKTQVGTFLRSCGFKDSCITWIPISAMENENLAKAASDPRLVSWYGGPDLMQAIDSLKPPKRDVSKPLIMPMCDVTRSASGQASIAGKLEAGALRVGLKVLVMPIGVATVRSLEQDSQPCSIARAGDNVSVTLQGIEGGYVMPGGVICHPDYPVSISNHLELKILVLNIVTPILMGSQVEFHIHHVKAAATVTRIVSLLDSKTGEVKKKLPRCLVAKQSAIVEVVLDEAICVEEFSKCRALGRAFLRSSGMTLAVGVVSRVFDDSRQG